MEEDKVEEVEEVVTGVEEEVVTGVEVFWSVRVMVDSAQVVVDTITGLVWAEEEV